MYKFLFVPFLVMMMAGNALAVDWETIAEDNKADAIVSNYDADAKDAASDALADGAVEDAERDAWVEKYEAIPGTDYDTADDSMDDAEVLIDTAADESVEGGEDIIKGDEDFALGDTAFTADDFEDAAGHYADALAHYDDAYDHFVDSLSDQGSAEYEFLNAEYYYELSKNQM